ncbi:deaminated glutathione amidase isoform 4-T4 [Mantella aurantiaca]
MRGGVRLWGVLRFRKMSGNPLIAVCQMTSTANKEDNFNAGSALIREAAAHSAAMVFLPEAFDFIGGDTQETLRLAESLEGGLVQRYAGLARECRLWLSLGGFHEKGPDWDKDRRISNSHLILDDTGSIRSVYRKAHLFDVDLQSGLSLKESDFTIPGAELVPPVCTPVGKVLLRARAVENQCYVAAAAQSGRHNGRRASYGHALVVDPWGAVVAQCQDGPGVCYAEVDLTYLHRVRREMPVQSHRRDDLYRAVTMETPGSADHL